MIVWMLSKNSAFGVSSRFCGHEENGANFKFDHLEKNDKKTNCCGYSGNMNE